MKGSIWGIMALALVLALSGGTAFAVEPTFDSGSTEAVDDFHPTGHVVVELPADGILNYKNVTIPSGVWVRFKRNANNTPVYILASGDVTINGTISVNGSGASGIYPGTGGPGGSDGGFAGTSGKAGANGLGPGGGEGGCYKCDGSGSSYGGKKGIFNILGYKLVALAGGSGGGGGGANGESSGGGGGGGGGAILIAASGTITVNGAVSANGGSGFNGTNGNYYNGTGGGGGGSGGAIKLMATTITGGGPITATGGGHGCNRLCGQTGSSGRIRLEAVNVLRTASSNPAFTAGYPGDVFADVLPVLKIVSVGGVDAPADLVGSFKQADIVFPRSVQNPVDVVISASNVPEGSTVTVSVVPEWGSKTNKQAVLSGTYESSTATASVNLSREYASVIIATVTFDLTLASADPVYFGGEKVVKVRVSAQLGGGSSLVYITESGREISAS
jgi:hypothetical protein